MQDLTYPKWDALKKHRAKAAEAGGVAKMAPADLAAYDRALCALIRKAKLLAAKKRQRL